jgi:5-methylcytosine rRNA methyltransferase NSUN4
MGKTPKGAEGFERFYREMYGVRWPAMKTALLEEPKRIPYSEGLLKPYFLDYGSYLAARAVEPEQGDSILDMCAAPGGKSLILAAALGGKGNLTSNDRSAARRRRLINVLDEHLPAESRRTVRVTGHDAARWCLYEQDAYDKVLLDAPCSSERHLLHSPKHLAGWSPARTRHLAQQAYAFLVSALRTAKPGGILVYSTCTISVRENDEVLAKLFAKYPDAAKIVPVSIEEGSSTAYGRLILPDADGGMGPMYIACLRKRPAGGSDEPERAEN